MRVGPAHALDALRCVCAVGPGRRQDVYWALQAALVHGPEDRQIFDQAFHLFFRNPRLLERLRELLMAAEPANATAAAAEEALQRRLAEAFTEPEPDEAVALESLDAPLTSSDRELLRERDFEQMSADELAEAKAAIAALLPALPQRPSRRQRLSSTGPRIDLRSTLRRARRHGGELLSLARVEAAERAVPIVLLCDVSGSMSSYSRLFLHFAHALTCRRHEVHSFVFATRLTHVSRALGERDPDRAVARVCAQVPDWAGGTRIAQCLRDFNQHWARRVLSDRAVVVLLSDGLERERTDLLAWEAARLGRTAQRWVWINPLLRYERFEPRASGIRAMLPHVSELRAAHNLRSLEELAGLLVT